MKNVKIKSIYLSNYKCFEKASIDCEKEDGTIYQWTVLLGNNFPLDSSTIFNEDDPKKLKEICLKLTNLNYTWRCGNHGMNIDSECALEKTFNIMDYGVSSYQSAHV